MRALETHPLVGVGAGQFAPWKYATAETPKEVIDNPGNAHNQFLSVAIEGGVPCAILFIVLLVALARKAQPAGLAVLAFFVLLSLAHDPLFHPEFTLALALALGVSTKRAQLIPSTRR